ncbi:hypothetical protein F4810DRAFT_711882 [Camillea tinctor]|nr:hypothetical protein F4810DRAFT_711882 [Camillea tinctor]
MSTNSSWQIARALEALLLSLPQRRLLVRDFTTPEEYWEIVALTYLLVKNVFYNLSQSDQTYDRLSLEIPRYALLETMRNYGSVKHGFDALTSRVIKLRVVNILILTPDFSSPRNKFSSTGPGNYSLHVIGDLVSNSRTTAFSPAAAPRPLSPPPSSSSPDPNNTKQADPIAFSVSTCRKHTKPTPGSARRIQYPPPSTQGPISSRRRSGIDPEAAEADADYLKLSQTDRPS